MTSKTYFRPKRENWRWHLPAHRFEKNERTFEPASITTVCGFYMYDEATYCESTNEPDPTDICRRCEPLSEKP